MIEEVWPTSLPGPADDNYEWQEQPRVHIVRFGDGYEQRSPDGLNVRPRTLSLDWPNLVQSEKDTLVDFLRARNASGAFWWVPPGEAQAIKVKAPNWSVRRTSGPYWSVTVNFEEVFDPGDAPTMSLDFKTKTYQRGTKTYSTIAKLPGHAYTRANAKYELNSSGAIISVAANVPGILLGNGFWSRQALTNLVLHSQNTFEAVWGKDGSTQTENSTTAPDGTTTADTLTSNGGGGAIYQYVQSLPTGPVTVSWFFKRNNNDWIRLEYNAANIVWFNLATGAIGTQQSATGYIRDCGNGWYRCTMTFTAAVANSYVQVALVSGDGAALAAQPSGQAVYLWQADVFAANLPDGGPLIVTTTAAVTVGADDLEVGAMLPDGDFIAWAVIDVQTLPDSFPFTFAVAGSGGIDDRVGPRLLSGTHLEFEPKAGGVFQPGPSTITNCIAVGRNVVMVGRRNGKYFSAARKSDGTIFIRDDASGVGAVPAATAVDIGCFMDGTRQVEGKVEHFELRMGKFSDLALKQILGAA